jgi:hypothetical protein
LKQKKKPKLCKKMGKKMKMQLKVINYFNYRFYYKRNVLAEPLKIDVGTPRFRGTQLEYHCSKRNSLSLVKVLWLPGIVVLKLQIKVSGESNFCNTVFNPSKTKRRLLYLKTQFVPRCKHFSQEVSEYISVLCSWKCT